MSEKKTLERGEQAGGAAGSERPAPRLAPLSMDEVVRIASEASIPAELTDRNLFRILLHSPRVAKAIQELLYAQLFGAALNGRLRELIIMRLGWATACDYEWAQHWISGQKAFGCSADDLLAVREWQSSPRFGAVERAVLAATDEILATGAISSDTWALCQTHLGSPQACLELVTAITTWHLISQVARSLQIPVEADTPSWPPDGRSPTNRMRG
jgi:alkylhydroperoxidase family enzyme